MASNVITQVVGGQKKILDSADSVADVRNQLGLSSTYKASVNGSPITNEACLIRDRDYVSFAEQVKGAFRRK